MLPSNCCRTEVSVWRSTIENTKARNENVCVLEPCEKECGWSTLRVAGVLQPQTEVALKEKERVET